MPSPEVGVVSEVLGVAQQSWAEIWQLEKPRKITVRASSLAACGEKILHCMKFSLLNYFQIVWAIRKLNTWKIMRIVSANPVKDCLSKNFLTRKFITRNIRDLQYIRYMYMYIYIWMCSVSLFHSWVSYEIFVCIISSRWTCGDDCLSPLHCPSSVQAHQAVYPFLSRGESKQQLYYFKTSAHT